MNYKLKYVCLTLLFLLCGGTAWSQDFDPSNPPDPYMLYKVVATANDGNYTSGSGSYTAGTVITLNTSAQSTVYTFRYWTKNGVQYTTDRQFSYTVEPENVTFRAVYEFNPDNPSDPQAIYDYRLYLVPDPEGACSFSRTSGAKAQAGSTVSVTAYANQGFVFDGWYNGETKVAETTTYSSFVMPSANTTLTAKFTYNPTLPGDPESAQANVDLGGVTGDANGDGTVNVNDVLCVIDYFLDKDPSPFNFNNADVNEDGTINVNDVLGIIDIIIH